ncbi:MULTISPECIES: nitrate/nitrite two-component system sensor histidine kinase NarX [Yersinia]|uniref:nitrate/nitrite two-component system sensor histidine kinase NarX n=1 Tax=Yersinia TaxID=629 RepID=UPI0005E19F13|nr:MULTISPECIES: nitrate/nitrite two-component system sensor histidine kinase NarX [Yersinia]OVZ95567.1 nitrate/nitrite two-component system sensor histidine kinase NarX [Yersinia frederiksenii]RXA97470.1 nitrate/nitrite two-component system sensor histidine kinase NarX [Yersinia sp. 2105 StPb PI]CNI26248.1 nitrate/nitrite sensor protein NarX [Yersinia frederiksenii]CNJ02239.1 nitrate/nitrite sensor protein NarX [Yersinia frederiksenii]CNL13241.1 nitrate/nitrite sensor protein NarX [Yersinia f
MKRYLIPLVNQIALLMILLGMLGLAGMTISSWMAQSIQGNAHAINKAGSLRMQSYRLLSMVPLDNRDLPYLTALEQDKTSSDLQHALQREGLTSQYQQIERYWQNTLKPQLLQAKHPDDVSNSVADFVHQLDALVLAIDHKTEQRLLLVTMIQLVFIVLTLGLLLATIYYLRRRLLRPWLQLISMANAIGRGDFSKRYTLSYQRDEMGMLGTALNRMSQELSLIYSDLEQRVAQKTADLQQKNQVLAFLYHSSRQLHTHQPLSERLVPVIEQLQALTPLENVQICLYENHLYRAHLADNADGEYLPPQNRPTPLTISGSTTVVSHTTSRESLSWSLSDKLGQYGLLLAKLPSDNPLNSDQQQLVNMLVEQLTSTLALESQARHQQQLLLMEERSAIARELHDSIAQSLSCLKIQISCLQMQAPDLPEPSKLLVQQMRDELNVAYRELRELLTTFRLKLNAATLQAALQTLVNEFGERAGVPITFDFNLASGAVPDHQAIHMVNIAREALNNIYKHAHASKAAVSVTAEGGDIVMSIIDNGCGIGQASQRPNHYGLIIMQDRAASLHGQCDIRQRDEGGTEVRVRFTPDNDDLD